MRAATATVSKRSRPKVNDVQGAALALAVFYFMWRRPPEKDNETLADYKYGQMQNQIRVDILRDYCPLFGMPGESEARICLMGTIWPEMLRLHSVLLKSDTLIRALAKQRKVYAWRRRGTK